jgi:hypothetical protein
MIKLLALTITITPAWWMLLAVLTIAWGIYALVKDIEHGAWNKDDWFCFPIYGIFWLFCNLVMWLIYFIIN